MKKYYTIDYKNKPTTLPVGGTIIAGLLLDRLKAPSFVWGLAIAFFVFYGLVQLLECVKNVE